jgi:hypothetical protein
MFPSVRVGDTILHPQVFSFGEHAWRRKYEILAVYPAQRFEKDDAIVNVRISCVDVTTGDAKLSEPNRSMWLSQVAESL